MRSFTLMLMSAALLAAPVRAQATPAGCNLVDVVELFAVENCAIHLFIYQGFSNQVDFAKVAVSSADGDHAYKMTHVGESDVEFYTYDASGCSCDYRPETFTYQHYVLTFDQRLPLAKDIVVSGLPDWQGAQTVTMNVRTPANAGATCAAPPDFSQWRVQFHEPLCGSCDPCPTDAGATPPDAAVTPADSAPQPGGDAGPNLAPRDSSGCTLAPSGLASPPPLLLVALVLGLLCWRRRARARARSLVVALLLLLLLPALSACGSRRPIEQNGDPTIAAGSWHLVASGDPDVILRAIWGSAADDIWAVGEGGTILHYDGRAWRGVRSPTSQQLDGVWGSSATDVWAVGQGGTILHYDGAAWSVMASPTKQWLVGIWGSSGSDIWAVADRAILRFDGAAWKQVPTPKVFALDSVWGSSAGDVWAVGTEVLHYDGSSWTVHSSINNDYGVSVGGATSEQPLVVIGNKGVLARYDGSSWKTVAEPSSGQLLAVWASSNMGVWAVGTYGAIVHYDGSTGTNFTPLRDNALTAIWGVGEELWAVGTGGVILRYGADG